MVIYLRTYLLFLCTTFLFFSTEARNSGATFQMQDTTSIEGLEIVEGLQFYVLGDWGRNGYFKQKEVANIMHRVSLLIKPDFIISTGDNYYPEGIASVDDPYIISSFESIYTGPNLFCPWYVVLGNHDYLGKYRAQIDYSNISQRWKMPSEYYFVDKEKEGLKVRFFFIDSSPFIKSYYEDSEYYNLHEQDTIDQLKWFNTALEGSEADWNITVSHHPLLPIDKEDDSFNIQQIFRKFLSSEKIEVAIAGHQHILAHFKFEESVAQQFISGAGSLAEEVDKGSANFLRAEEGFWIFTVLADKILAQALNSKGEVVYKTQIKK